MKKEDNAMKRFILSMFFVAVFAPLAFSGDPLLLKEVKTTLGVSSARPFGIYEDNSYIFTYGYILNIIDIRQSAFLACFDSTLALKWAFTDSSSDRPYIATAINSKNRTIAALHDGWKSGTTLLFINETGTLIKRIPFEGTVSLGKSGEKIIAVTAGTRGVVYTMDENGEILNQWSSPYYNGGHVKIQTLGNAMWLSSFSFEGTYVAKHNAGTGEIFWRHVIPNGILGYSDIDSVGNSYFGGVQFVPNSEAPGFNIASQHYLEKLDPDGNIIWKAEWFVRETWIGRVNAGVTTVSVNSAKNLVIIGGDIQKEETIANGSRTNYLAGFSMDSGKIAWEKKWSYSDAYISTVWGACFDTEGDMLVAGYEYNNGSSPAFLHIGKYSVEGIPTDVEEELAIPASFSLSQNYPNPFNPTTTISYELPKAVHVTLKVYDVLGNEVKTLVNEMKEMGKYTATFDASSLASGMYIYRLQVGKYNSTKKMVLLK